MKLPVLLAFVGLSVASSVGAATNPVLPPGVKSAIERFSQDESGFQPKLMAPGFRNLPMLQSWAPWKEKVCSIPLREKQVDHPERFRSRIVPAPRITDPIGHAAPAPKCDMRAMAEAQ